MGDPFNPAPTPMEHSESTPPPRRKKFESFTGVGRSVRGSQMDGPPPVSSSSAPLQHSESAPPTVGQPASQAARPFRVSESSVDRARPPDGYVAFSGPGRSLR
eukprot:NODE_3401_length_401_cov_307.965909_g2862_i0.p1 GENE.NODE_3401_length_401_cov_307.965909_g2862_i0~~NODE_3401_length_401_cov_307.965909_g2862_i0.p1  ORF type:complete len:114 (-),score=20.94 NODE_3401_length_401_cov_307.965909_g2862_i0:59-367(-)